MKVSPLLLPARRPRVLTCQMFATFVRLYLAHEPAELRYGRSTAPAPAATSEVAPRAAEDAWATTRDGRFFTSVLSSSPVRRWCPRTFVCHCRSCPSPVRSYGIAMTPALLTRRLRLFPWAFSTRRAAARTDARSARSISSSTADPPEAPAAAACSRTCATAASPRSRDRHPRTTRAPRLASALAASRPVPLLAPVMSAVTWRRSAGASASNVQPRSLEPASPIAHTFRTVSRNVVDAGIHHRRNLLWPLWPGPLAAPPPPRLVRPQAAGRIWIFTGLAALERCGGGARGGVGRGMVRARAESSPRTPSPAANRRLVFLGGGNLGGFPLERSVSGGWTAGAIAARLGGGGPEFTASGVPREAFQPGDLDFPRSLPPARAPRPLFSPSGNTPISPLVDVSGSKGPASGGPGHAAERAPPQPHPGRGEEGLGPGSSQINRSTPCHQGGLGPTNKASQQHPPAWHGRRR